MNEEPQNTQPIERKLATILSADVAGYSRMVAEAEEETVSTFRAHREIFESIVALHRGRVFNTAGDAILAEFSSPVEAVRCAIEIQAALRTSNEKLTPAGQVKIRIGVNIGDVVVQGTDLLGHGVNVAARLQSIAEPGGICISGSVYDQIRNKLSLAFKPLGEQKYKNIPQSVRTYSIAEAEDHGTLPYRHFQMARRQVPKFIAGGALACLPLIAGGAYLMQARPARPAAEPQSEQRGGSAQRIAYVIGNTAYREMRKIANPGRDANRVAEALEQRGFKVVKLLDLERTAMIRAIEEFESTLSVVGGVGLFYYAGSAAYIEGEDVLLPIDVTEDSAKNEYVGGVNLTQLTNEIRAKTTQRMTDNGFAVVYSASKGQKAADGPPGGNSPFTDQFVKALAYQEDELSDLFRRIRLQMAQTSPQQTPFFEDARKVKFFFNRSDQDNGNGVVKILIFDSCRDNPFKRKIAT